MLDLESVHFSFLAVSYFVAQNRSEFPKMQFPIKKKSVITWKTMGESESEWGYK